MSQIAFHLYGGEAGFDVDAPATTRLRFQLDGDEIVLAKVQPAIEQDRLDVRLDVGLGAHRAASELARKGRQINDRGHQSELRVWSWARRAYCSAHRVRGDSSWPRILLAVSDACPVL